MGKSTVTRAELELVFKHGAPVRGTPTGVFNEKGELIQRKDGVIIGRGFFESDLIDLGLTKRELKQLVQEHLLEKVTTKFKGAWRNTYVLRDLEGKHDS